MKARGKKAKGSRFERNIAGLYRKHGFKGTTRMPGSGAFETLKGDIRFPFHVPFRVECKNDEKISIWKGWRQARSQASEHEEPVLFMKRNFGPELGIVSAEYLIRLQAIAQDKEA